MDTEVNVHDGRREDVATPPVPLRTPTSGWGSPTGRGVKAGVLIALLASFAGQTLLVYTDGGAGEPLSPTAQRGRRLWHQNNCQVCHQLYGFGGFLGPDLTNAAVHVTPERLEDLLTNGSEIMPAYEMSPGNVDAVGAFLAAIDRTGRGQARALYGGDPTELLARFETTVERRLLTTAHSPAAAGFEIVRAQVCHACHIPFRRSINGAADMSFVADRLTRDEILTVLRDGVGTAMPAPRLSEDERETVYEYLAWLFAHREELLDELGMSAWGSIEWADVPWWEYR